MFLKFVSNAVVDSSAMQIGSFGDDGMTGAPTGRMGAYPESEGPMDEWGYYEDVNAVGHYKGYLPSSGKGGA